MSCLWDGGLTLELAPPISSSFYLTSWFSIARSGFADSKSWSRMSHVGGIVREAVSSGMFLLACSIFLSKMGNPYSHSFVSVKKLSSIELSVYSDATASYISSASNSVIKFWPSVPTSTDYFLCSSSLAFPVRLLIMLPLNMSLLAYFFSLFLFLLDFSVGSIRYLTLGGPVVAAMMPSSAETLSFIWIACSSFDCALNQDLPLAPLG